VAQADHPFHGPARLRSKSLQKFYNILNHLVRSYYPFSPPLDRMHVKFLLSIFTAKCEELVTDCELRVHNCTSFGYNNCMISIRECIFRAACPFPLMVERRYDDQKGSNA